MTVWGETENVKVIFSVCNTNLRYQVQKFMRDKQDSEICHPPSNLPQPLNPCENKPLFVAIHENTEKLTSQVSTVCFKAWVNT